LSKFDCKIKVSIEDLIIENILASSANRRVFIDFSKIEGI
jgi:hypothetical protein